MWSRASDPCVPLRSIGRLLPPAEHLPTGNCTAHASAGISHPRNWPVRVTPSGYNEIDGEVREWLASCNGGKGAPEESVSGPAGRQSIAFNRKDLKGRKDLAKSAK